MRKPIIAGNWKMNGTITEATILVEELKSLLGTEELPCDVVLCPPFTTLATVLDLVDETLIGVGAQNMDYHESGAFTGEVSPAMITEVGAQYVILGHSERREYYGETDAAVNAKIKAAFQYDLTPIVCVGESLEQREANHTKAWIEGQLEGAFKDIPKEEAMETVIAYEPIWAIGTGKTATDDQANEVCTFIRKTIADLFGQEAADKVRIQYGGSVKPATISNLMAKSDIDGALVGGASLKAEDFSQIVKF